MLRVGAQLTGPCRERLRRVRHGLDRDASSCLAVHFGHERSMSPTSGDEPLRFELPIGPRHRAAGEAEVFRQLTDRGEAEPTGRTPVVTMVATWERICSYGGTAVPGINMDGSSGDLSPRAEPFVASDPETVGPGEMDPEEERCGQNEQDERDADRR